mmetsp:Transcript_22851/g.33507  ORF Transcript_22851/g.33507 Transcript_22851/m.33507 type:complete len:95 (+) Transcript_22851:93-377(+)
MTLSDSFERVRHQTRLIIDCLLVLGSGCEGAARDSKTSEEKEIEREMDQEIERQIQLDEIERQMKVDDIERQLRESKTPDTSDHRLSSRSGQWM